MQAASMAVVLAKNGINTHYIRCTLTAIMDVMPRELTVGIKTRCTCIRGMETTPIGDSEHRRHWSFLPRLDSRRITAGVSAGPLALPFIISLDRETLESLAAEKDYSLQPLIGPATPISLVFILFEVLGDVS